MTIGIDFDGTFARDPEFWTEVVGLAGSRGHQCVLVTGRSDEGELGAQVRKAVGTLMPIVFADKDWKRDAATKKGWKVDVWIDDNPEYVAKQNLLIGLGR